MLQKIVTTTADAETGEVLDFQLVAVPRPKPKLKGWLMTFQDALERLAKDNTMTVQQTRVLWYLMSKIDFENYIAVSQIDVCEALNMQPPNVSRAIATLVKKGLLLRGPKVSQTSTFRLSPYMGWKGSAGKCATERMNSPGLKLVIGGRDARQREALEKHGQRRIDE